MNKSPLCVRASEYWEYKLNLKSLLLRVYLLFYLKLWICFLLFILVFLIIPVLFIFLPSLLPLLRSIFISLFAILQLFGLYNNVAEN